MTDNTYPLDPGEVLVIHASAVRTDDGALIFLGPSETGKSTICSLLSRHLEPVADDLVGLIPCTEGKWTVLDAQHDVIPITWAEAQASAPDSPLLRAIFRLHQAPVASLEQVDSLQTCRYLTDAFFEARWQRLYSIEMKTIAFAALAAIARSIPGYRLHFHLSPQVFGVIDAGINSNRSVIGNHRQDSCIGSARVSS